MVLQRVTFYFAHRRCSVRGRECEGVGGASQLTPSPSQKSQSRSDNTLIKLLVCFSRLTQISLDLVNGKCYINANKLEVVELLGLWYGGVERVCPLPSLSIPPSPRLSSNLPQAPREAWLRPPALSSPRTTGAGLYFFMTT